MDKLLDNGLIFMTKKGPDFLLTFISQSRHLHQIVSKQNLFCLEFSFFFFFFFALEIQSVDLKMLLVSEIG